MTTDSKSLLRLAVVNGWWLFWLISVAMSIVMVVAMTGVDLSTGSGVSEMIGFSVRWAVPFIYIVVAASSVRYLFPNPFTLWWLRNRRIFGLCFAVAMAWQGLFIFMMSVWFRDYYYEDVYLLRDELEGTTGYIFLVALVLTSFDFGRKRLSVQQWRVLHRTAVYFLWAYPFSVYWWNLSYYGDPQPIDYLFYWSGFLAVALRIAAWGKRRQANGITPSLFKVPGATIIALGLIWSVASLYLQDQVTAFLTAPAWSATLELWLPFWPLEPFLSLFIIGAGTLLATRSTVDP
jgi:hypothetical protein